MEKKEFDKLTERQQQYYLAGRSIRSESKKILYKLYESAKSDLEKEMLDMMIRNFYPCY